MLLMLLCYLYDTNWAEARPPPKAALKIPFFKKKLVSRLQLLADQVEAQNLTIDALSKFSSEQRVLAYVQNCLTLAIHGQRAGDSSTTMCGMKVGPARVKRGAVRYLNTIAGESWELL